MLLNMFPVEIWFNPMDLGSILNDAVASLGSEGGGLNPPPGSEGSALGHHPNSHQEQEQESNYGFNNQSINRQDNMVAEQHRTQDSMVAEQHRTQDNMVAQQHMKSNEEV